MTRESFVKSLRSRQVVYWFISTVVAQNLFERLTGPEILPVCQFITSSFFTSCSWVNSEPTRYFNNQHLVPVSTWWPQWNPHFDHVVITRSLTELNTISMWSRWKKHPHFFDTISNNIFNFYQDHSLYYMFYHFPNIAVKKTFAYFRHLNQCGKCADQFSGLQVLLWPCVLVTITCHYVHWLSMGRHQEDRRREEEMIKDLISCFKYWQHE